MRKVDFFIVGQPKSGTTALASFLDEHPEIAISIPKETGYMSTDHRHESDTFHGQAKFFHIRTIKDYEKTFSHAKNNQLRGDASTNYLYSKAAAKEIKKHNPSAKVIMLLRNPADMIYSLYNQYRNEAKETAPTFEKALAFEAKRKKGKNIPKDVVTPSYLFYRQRGKYADQVARYMNEFPKAQLFIAAAEDFRSDNAKIYGQVLKFLKCKDTSFRPQFDSVHATKRPRSTLLNRLAHTHEFKTGVLKALGQSRYTWLQKNIMTPLLLKKSSSPKMDQQLRLQLLDYFSDDIAKLSRETGIDFSTKWNLYS